MRLNLIACMAWMTLYVPVAIGAEQRAAAAGFVISIDRTASEKAGFQYPVTCIFGVSRIGPEARVSRRGRGTDPWSPLEARTAADVADRNKRFDEVVEGGGVSYALWHPDRFKNSVIYDRRPGVDGRQGSTLMAHLARVANGWMYSHRYVADRARVTPGRP